MTTGVPAADRSAGTPTPARLTVGELEQLLDLARQCGAQADTPLTITHDGLLHLDLHAE